MINYIENLKEIYNEAPRINEFSKVAEYNINTQQSITFLYINKQHAEIKIKNKISFTIVPKEIKYSGIEFKYVQGLCDENFKMMMKQIKKLRKGVMYHVR